MVTVLEAPPVWEVTARPPSKVAGRLTVADDPGMTVQSTPSGEVEAVKVEPVRVTSR
jgi:hypothetical protein